MIRKITSTLLIISFLILFALFQTAKGVEAKNIFDFFNFNKTVNELVYGQDQEDTDQKPNLFQNIANWFGGLFTKKTKPPESTPDSTSVKNPFPTQAQKEAPELEERSTLPDPDNAGQPIPSAKPTLAPQNNLSGHWGGDYVVNFPDECKGEKGSWSADLIQTGNRLGGSFSSDAGGGQVGGNVGGGGVSWSVGGSGGQIQFTGKITGPNSVLGTFTGVVCDEEKAPQQTTGTFFGGRL